MASSITSVCISTFLIFCCFRAAQGDINMAKDCCLRVSDKPIPLHVVRTYMSQKVGDGCDISAIIFITKGELRLCAPTGLAWVKDLKIKVDSRWAMCRTKNFKPKRCHSLRRGK
ncbi:C-C motif chemokine 19 [Amia ocellicauda]|uniref:C-C motif chemokine 19 n=1 Tax=Amia ocellicauda TaxID=2972642 RepID=UPI0034644C89